MPAVQRITHKLRGLTLAIGLIITCAGVGLADDAQIAQTGYTCNSCTPKSCCPCPDNCIPPGTAQTQPGMPVPDPSAQTPSPLPDPTLSADVAFSPLQSSLGLPETVAISPGGYIDDAIPRTSLRIRYDSAYDNNRPDRAEYFYAKCGCFRRLGIDPGAAGPVPNGPNGGRLLETGVDYQDVRLQMEYALRSNASVFVELPFRFLDPEVNDNTAGFADLNFGFKYALVADCDRYLTFQLRAYVPTGDSTKGLGTDHYSIEPGLLFYRQLTDKLVLIGEFKDWIPLDANDGATPTSNSANFSGNILQYGAGLGYEMYRNCCSGTTVTPVVEVVGWTILDGLSTASSDGTLATFRLQGAEDTIVNAKFGVRIGFDGNGIAPGSQANSSSLYVGYGRALTGTDRWYEDIVRVEYRMNF